MMRILRHRLCQDNGDPFPFRRSPNQSGAITPEYLVIHYTAGSSAEGAISWLTNPQAQASAHLVISKDGETTQLVPFNRKAWHAGRSSWAGRSGLNSFSIGIELDNQGKLVRHESGWRNEWGTPVDPGDVIQATHKNGGPQCGWHAFTPEQLEAARDVCVLLARRYDIKDVVGHDDIAPTRKVDPGPAFPMDSFRAAIIGRGQDEAPELFETTTDLNIRKGPGTHHDKLPLSPLPKGTRLAVVSQEGSWRLVDVLEPLRGEMDVQGWVHGRYIKPTEA